MKNSRLFLILLYGMLFMCFSTSIYAQWIKTNGPSSDQIICLTVPPNGSSIELYAGTANWGIYQLAKGDTNWAQTGLTNAGIGSIAFSNTNIFAGTAGSGIWLSTNSGTEWTQTNFLIDYFIDALVFIGTNLFAGTNGLGIYLSTNYGATWTQIDNGLMNYSIQALAVIDSNLFAGTGNGVYVSTNSSMWTRINTVSTNFYVYSFAVSGTNLFAGTNKGVYLFTNNGTSWNATSIGFTNENVLSVITMGENLFAASGDSVYLSTNNGSIWTQVSAGLPNSSIWALAVNNINLFAGTYNSGVWRRPLSELITTVKGNEDQVPAQFRLDQNYPNPLNPSTTINYSIPKAGQVTLKVYDVLGKEVATLVNEEESSGNYHIVFNANKLASGVYFYRLSAGNSVITKKLILMK
jgi:ligand-binding sensor domain-containing protein